LLVEDKELPVHHAAFVPSLLISGYFHTWDAIPGRISLLVSSKGLQFGVPVVATWSYCMPVKTSEHHLPYIVFNRRLRTVRASASLSAAAAAAASWAVMQVWPTD
jgi:hypothetical protein